MVRAGRDATGSWHLGRGAGRGVWWCKDGVCASELCVGHVARALRSAVRESELATIRGLTSEKRP